MRMLDTIAAATALNGCIFASTTIHHAAQIPLRWHSLNIFARELNRKMLATYEAASQ